MSSIPCPFTDREGNPCPGYIVRITGEHAGVVWEAQANGEWSFAAASPGRYRLWCSCCGRHADGWGRADPRMTRSAGQLSEAMKRVVWAVARTATPPAGEASPGGNAEDQQDPRARATAEARRQFEEHHAELLSDFRVMTYQMKAATGPLRVRDSLLARTEVSLSCEQREELDRRATAANDWLAWYAEASDDLLVMEIHARWPFCLGPVDLAQELTNVVAAVRCQSASKTDPPRLVRQCV